MSVAAAGAASRRALVARRRRRRRGRCRHRRELGTAPARATLRRAPFARRRRGRCRRMWAWRRSLNSSCRPSKTSCTGHWPHPQGGGQRPLPLVVAAVGGDARQLVVGHGPPVTLGRSSGTSRPQALKPEGALRANLHGAAVVPAAARSCSDSKMFPPAAPHTHKALEGTGTLGGWPLAFRRSLQNFTVVLSPLG